jgi:hypothetical protein
VGVVCLALWEVPTHEMPWLFKSKKEAHNKEKAFIFINTALNKELNCMVQVMS